MSLLQSTGALSVTCKRCKKPKTIHYFAETKWTSQYPVCRECDRKDNMANRKKWTVKAAPPDDRIDFSGAYFARFDAHCKKIKKLKEDLGVE